VTEQIRVGKDLLEIKGISGRGMIGLFLRFPALQKWFVGGGIEPEEMLKGAPDAIAAIIAAGTGHPNEIEHELIADGLPVDVQLDALEAIGRTTFSRGFGPFVKRIRVLFDGAVSENYGKAPGTNSPPASKPSSTTGTAPVPGT
jgi:hypothetical protein